MKNLLICGLAAAALSTCAFAADGAALYKKCVACHGKAGEKKALGKSEIIAELDAQTIKNALKGYKEGTFGGAAKAQMEKQVKKLSDEDIDALTDYIVSFKK